MNLKTLTHYLDQYLRIAEFDDVSDNGLQVEGAGEITKVAFAVDACVASFDAAVSAEAQMIVVHHGLFWGRVRRLVGPHYYRVKSLLESGVSLYACHLPLDAHAEVGNNAELARLIGLRNARPFGEYRGSVIGVGGALEPPLPLSGFAEHIQLQIGTALRVYGFSLDPVQCVAIVSGGAVNMVDQVADGGYDTFVTGETTHNYYHDIREYGVNVISAGHYATETVGLKALARHLGPKFGLETVFIDLPTGA